MSGSALRGPAPAKINLTLEILGRRPDGYHELRSVLQTLELAGEVEVETGPAGPDRLVVVGPYAVGTPIGTENLALRAVAALRSLGVAVPPLAIRLEKRVPAAGGLGGGASDAATVLRLLDRMLGLECDHRLLGAANVIGSDEAALFLGGTVLVSGRGEVVEALPGLAERGVVLFVPPLTLDRKTARMFSARSALGGWDDGSRTAALADRIGRGDPVGAGDCYNSFDGVADQVAPGTGRLAAELAERTGGAVHLAGAGPTLFWIGDPGRAAEVAGAAAGLDCTVIETRTAPSPWR